MRVFLITAAALFITALSVVAENGSAQPAGKIDYQRDVQPIFQAHCISCHGPELQMNGLRLDRRADALRGGTQTDIGPGNADGSRLYHRLVGTNFGQQMPPGRPLGEGEIEIIKRWIDEGAEWPDELSGEAPTPPVDADSAQLIALIRDGQATRIDELLRRNPQAASRRGPRGSTPLMAAALYGDATLVKRLLVAGADPNARTSTGATPLIWAVPDVAKLQLLLDAGADVNARSEERRTALLVASSTVGAAPALRLLLDYGAQPWPCTRTIHRRSAKLRASVTPTCFGDCSITGWLRRGRPLRRRHCFARIASGARSSSTSADPVRYLRCLRHPAPARPRPFTTRAAPRVRHRLVSRRPHRPPFTPPSSAAFRSCRTSTSRSSSGPGCVSCHHNSLVAMAVSSARSHGYTINEAIAKKQPRVVTAYLDTWRDRTIQNLPIAGGADTIGYLLFGLAVEGTRGPSTDAQAIWLLRRQAPDGRWPVQTLRPPIESNDIEVTAITTRAIQAYAPPAGRPNSRQPSIARAGG